LSEKTAVKQVLRHEEDQKEEQELNFNIYKGKWISPVYYDKEI
jgi:hypothetical protein